MRKLSFWLFYRPRVAWVGVLFVCLSVVIAALPSSSEPLIRFDGFVLQLFGLVTIIIGITGTRKLFGLPGLGAQFLEWLAQRPRLRQGTRTIRGVGGLASATASGRGKLRSTVGPDASLEERVRVLEANFEALDRSMDAQQRQLDDLRSTSEEALNAERRTRQEKVRRVEEKLAQAETGGIFISFVGVIWLIVGLFITTASQEIAALF